MFANDLCLYVLYSEVYVVSHAGISTFLDPLRYMLLQAVGKSQVVVIFRCPRTFSNIVYLHPHFTYKYSHTYTQSRARSHIQKQANQVCPWEGLQLCQARLRGVLPGLHEPAAAADLFLSFPLSVCIYLSLTS